MRILLIVILLSFMTGCLSSFKVTGYSGGTVIIYCHYSTEDRSHEKYFCKGPKWTYSCDKKITTLRKNTWFHSGRFSLYDITGGNYFKVIIRKLTSQDEGTYWCGVDKPAILTPDSYTEVELDVKEGDCCEKSVTETAFLGGEATIRCNYSEDREDSVRYFCKEDSESDCEYQISGTYYSELGRYSISKRRRERFSTVTIRDLTEDDTGTYWCGVETSRTEQCYITLITQVKLLVRNWRNVRPVKKTGHVGEVVSLWCKYPRENEEKEKIFCKGDSPSTCEDKITSRTQNKMADNGRFSLFDNREKTNFTVHIKELRPEDSGTYWCVSDRRWRPADYTRFILSVALPATTTFISKPSSSSPSSSSPSSPSSSPSSPSSSQLVNGFGTSVVVMVSVSLVVLLLVISLIIVYRWKYNKATGSVSSTHRVSPDTGINEGGCHGDGDYEEIKERPLQSDSDAATSTIYATVNLPTSESDSLHYSSVSFHKIPRIPYEATDTITKEGSCPNEATASIAKVGTSSCDYATVNFGQSPAYSTVNHPHSSSEAPPIYSTISKPRDT
ncbi:polymeric immunoglobulin receptor-like isoform 2-T2 [Salvelinus alpinus]